MADKQIPKTRIIVDCQVLQTNDRMRGMGFYLKSLLENIAKDNGAANFEWVFLVNPRLKSLAEEDAEIVGTFNGRILKAPLLHMRDREIFGDAAPENRKILDKILETLLGDMQFERTVYFIPAMFSREVYPVYPTHSTANLMLFYDLIPFLFNKQYFPGANGLASQDYCQRFSEFYKATQIATISQTTADDLSVYFGVDPTRIVSILGAAADRSGLRPARPKIADKLKDGFVFMPTGDDYRKNNIKAAQAFAALNTQEKLVVTSNFTVESKRMLQEICPNILFTGAVSDSEYLWLFDNAKTVLSPTQYEGLGMPILEAVERGASITCSNIPVFAEISQTAFYNFDPNSSSSMAQALQKALATDSSSRTEWERKKEQYPDILQNFSWSKTAKLFLEAAETCNPAGNKQKLAVFCPSPISYSAVGKYVFEVHAELSQLYDVDYFVEEGQTSFQPTRTNILEYAANYFPAGSFDVSTADGYDQILYHIGNSEFHVDSILNALRLPANVVIHDTRLNGIFDYMHNRGFITAERRDFESKLNEAFSCRKSDCLVSISTNQQSVFCHSNFAHGAISEANFKDGSPELYQAALPIGVPKIQLQHDGDTVVSFAGIISEDKGINLVSGVSKLDDVRVKVFGYGILGNSPLLQNLGYNVAIVKDLTDKEFQDVTRMSDILVSYRPNYHGETSKSALEAMRYGTVVIVKKIGWFDELPDDTVVKVSSEAEVLDAVKMLVSNPSKRKQIGNAAREFLMNNHSYKLYAQQLKAGMGT
jgi:glycosyltransferase involved in cell wall biosynthesis